MDHMPTEMPCPNCEEPIAGGIKVKEGNEWPECPHCGCALKKNVPIFAPPMGGSHWWSWGSPGGGAG